MLLDIQSWLLLMVMVQNLELNHKNSNFNKELIWEVSAQELLEWLKNSKIFVQVVKL